MQIDYFELVYCFESTGNELYVALYFTSLAAFVADVRSL